MQYIPPPRRSKCHELEVELRFVMGSICLGGLIVRLWNLGMRGLCLGLRRRIWRVILRVVGLGVWDFLVGGLFRIVLRWLKMIAAVVRLCLCLCLCLCREALSFWVLSWRGSWVFYYIILVLSSFELEQSHVESWWDLSNPLFWYWYEVWFITDIVWRV